MTPEDLLLAGADYIAEHGHHKGAFFLGAMADGRSAYKQAAENHGKPACAIGAINAAAWANESRRDEAWEARALLMQHLNPRFPACVGVPDWNDAPERTAEDVILAMKRAAHHE
ncbi:DUF6197 family protein [Streptomyces sp. NPDC055085]